MLTPKRFTIEEAQELCAKVMRYSPVFRPGHPPEMATLWTARSRIYVGRKLLPTHGATDVYLTSEDRENWV